MRQQKQATIEASYGLYFLGQNIFYMLIYMYLNTYYTDIGISAAAGLAIALFILHFYKLNDHDVQLMAKVNSGELVKEEADKQMTRMEENKLCVL